MSEIEALRAEVSQLRKALHGEQVALRIATNTFVRTKCRLPADVVAASLKGNFQQIGGRTVAIDEAGQQIYSRRLPGQLADVDEAIEMLIERSANRGLFLNGASASASTGSAGAAGGNGGTSQGGAGASPKTLTRAQFQALPPADQMAFSKQIRAGGAVLVD